MLLRDHISDSGCGNVQLGDCLKKQLARNGLCQFLLPAGQSGGEKIIQRLRRKAWPRHHDNMRVTEQLLPLMPTGQVVERITADK